MRHFRQCFAVMVSLVMLCPPQLVLSATASGPAWWTERQVITAGGVTDDYAVANQGQLKNLATKAAQAMEMRLSGGAGAEVMALVNGWNQPSPAGVTRDDYAVVTLGQLKAVAKPFYDRLIAAGVTTIYPWSNSASPADDYAVANIGQVKQVFSFELPESPEEGDDELTRDTDGDGIPDWWENRFGSNPNNASDANTDPNNTGYTFWARYNAMLNGNPDPVTGLTPGEVGMGSSGGGSSSNNAADTDKDGFTDYQETYFGYDKNNPSDHPPAPRYVVVDLGAGRNPIKISAENGWVLSRGSRWHNGEWHSLPEEFWGTDINSDGCVVGEGKLCAEFGWKGYYINAQGARMGISAPEFNHQTNFIHPSSEKGMAWGQCFTGENSVVYAAAGFGDFQVGAQWGENYLFAPIGFTQGILGTAPGKFEDCPIDHHRVENNSTFSRHGTLIEWEYDNGSINSYETPNPSLPFLDNNDSWTRKYLNICFYDTNADLIAVGEKEFLFGEPVWGMDGDTYSLISKDRKEVETGAAYFINAQSDGNYLIAARNHLWERKRNEEGGFVSPVAFGAPVKLSSLVDWNCGWVDKWNITGMNDTGLLIGTGYKIKEGCEKHTDDGELIIDPEEYADSDLERRGFLMVPASLAADRNRDGKIDLREGGDTHSKIRPFRFWINNDSDQGDVGDSTSDIPAAYGNSGNRIQNRYDTVVNGRADLIDWFPIAVDVRRLLAAFPNGSIQLRLNTGFNSARFVPTNLAPDAAADYQCQSFATGFGVGGNFPPEQATALSEVEGVSGIPLDQDAALMARLREEPVVFMVEARQDVIDEISLQIWANNKGTYKYLGEQPLYVQFSEIKDMYRWVNLRDQANGGSVIRATDLKEPPNWPDALTNGKNFVFLHGYNVNETQSNAWASESFKRMYWSGSRAKHYFVTWFGDDSQLFDSVTVNFHVNVIHALETGPSLASFINELEGDVSTCAHSLGNMVVLEALNLGNGRGASPGTPAKISCHFAFDAAVPAEALDKGNLQNSNMAMQFWLHLPENMWASEWHLLFPASDWRSKLTWRDRLASLNSCAVYNFYSSGEEVLNFYTDSSTNGIVSAFKNMLNLENLFEEDALRGEYAWWLQELLKGQLRSTLRGILGSTYGGWGVGTGYLRIDPDTKEVLGISDNFPSLPWSSERLKYEPLFLYGSNEVFEENASSEPVTTLYDPDKGSSFAQQHHKKLIAEMIPSRTTAMGREAVGKLTRIGGNNFDLMSTDFRNAWPQVRIADDQRNIRWLHGDAKDISYYFNYLLWDKWIELGELNKERNQ